MKLSSLKFLLLTSVALSFSACNKQKEDPHLNEKNLTTCEGARCDFLFTEYADLIFPQMNFKSGDYRVFWYGNTIGPLATRLFIKAPMSGTEFILNEQDILNEKVVFKQSCPSCDYIQFKPIGGYVKGINTTPGNQADQTKWLLEAKVFMEAVNSPLVKDTLYIKQYYYPSFIYN